jgi:hypothetical protein
MAVKAKHEPRGKREMDIETKNASLDTLAVTILALHVSGKQMTLAVFRQLPEGVEQQGSELWGTVRYAIKDSGDLWLVFSNDGRLFRRSLNLRSPWAEKYELRKAEKELKLLERYGASWREPALDEKINAARLAVASEYAAWQEKYYADVARYENEKKLSELRQLFISV